MATSPTPFKVIFDQHQAVPTLHFNDGYFSGGYWVEYRRHWFHHRWCVVYWEGYGTKKMFANTLLAFKCPQEAIKAATRLSEARYA